MSKKRLHIIEYTIALINEFAVRYQLTEAESFEYNNKWHWMKLIEQCYDVMHTLSFADGVKGMAAYCRRQGGTL